jgi:hypothetical protein
MKSDIEVGDYIIHYDEKYQDQDEVAFLGTVTRIEDHVLQMRDHIGYIKCGLKVESCGKISVKAYDIMNSIIEKMEC